MKIDKRLELVSPNWYKKITNAKSLKQLLRKTHVSIDGLKQSLDLALPAYCVIGESHNFSAGYYNSDDDKKPRVVQDGCIKCTMHSTGVYSAIKDCYDYKQFSER